MKTKADDSSSNYWYTNSLILKTFNHLSTNSLESVASFIATKFE